MSHRFLKRDTKLVSYMAYPRFLMNLKLNETCKLIYVLLLDRARLSMAQDGWTDQNGHVYIFYDIKSLATDSAKSIDTVKDVLKKLEKAGLILREKQPKIGKSRKIYVKTMVENSPPPSGENCTDGREIIPLPVRNISTPNKSNLSKPKRNYNFEEEESL